MKLLFVNSRGCESAPFHEKVSKIVSKYEITAVVQIASESILVAKSDLKFEQLLEDSSIDVGGVSIGFFTKVTNVKVDVLVTFGREDILNLHYHPHYHFSPSNSFSELLPYWNSSNYTRNITLPSYSSTSKWFYAFNFNRNQSPPETVIENPYSIPEKQQAITSTKRKFVSKSPPSNYVCVKCKIPGHFIRNCPSQSLQKCWFCLSNPNIETHLIVHVSSQYYIALAKGGIYVLHLLIVPIEHIDLLSDNRINEIRSCFSIIESIYKEYSKNYVIGMLLDCSRDVSHKVNECDPGQDSDGKRQSAIQRYFILYWDVFQGADGKVQHYHMQTIPLAKEAESFIFFIKHEAISASLTYSEIMPEGKSFTRTIINSGNMYFYSADGANDANVIQFVRMAVVKFLGCPEKLTWKNCVENSEKEGINAEFIKKLVVFEPLINQ